MLPASPPGLVPYLYAAAGGVSSLTLWATEESPLLDGAPKWVRFVVWGCAVLAAVVGVAAAVRRFIRDEVAESDKKTATAVSGVSSSVVDAVRQDLDKFRQEQETRNKALGPRLVSIDSNLRDLGDVRGELQGMAYQVGELDNRVTKTERDISAFHDWKRKHQEEHRKGDELLKLWARQMEERNKTRPSEEQTPPTGWRPDPSEGGEGES